MALAKGQFAFEPLDCTLAHEIGKGCEQEDEQYTNQELVHEHLQGCNPGRRSGSSGW